MGTQEDIAATCPLNYGTHQMIDETAEEILTTGVKRHEGRASYTIE